MTSAPASMISEHLEVAKSFSRSVNVEKDFSGSTQNGDYILTDTVLQALTRVSESLESKSTSRAWTITGPYGGGKSAFAVFLSRLLCSRDEMGRRARQHLASIDSQLSRHFQPCENGGEAFFRCC